MSKNDDESGYDLGDLLAGALIAATATAVGVGAMLLRKRGRVARRPVPAPPPPPPIAVEERGDDDAADDVPHVGADFN